MYKQNHERIPVPEGTRKLLTRIQIDSTEAITSVAISPDASLLAASTTSSVKLFHLSRTEDESSERLRVRKIAAPETIGHRLHSAIGSSGLTFSPGRTYVSQGEDGDPARSLHPAGRV